MLGSIGRLVRRLALWSPQLSRPRCMATGIKEKAFKHVSDMKHAMENKAVRTMSQLRL